MRPLPVTAVFAGTSYPAETAQLLKQFSTLLDSKVACSAPKISHAPRHLIVPHIDFRVNLELYARSYSLLLKYRRWPEIFYILGVGHSCPHEFSACRCDYETPLGRIFSDNDSLEQIQNECGFNVAQSPSTFKHEHSQEYVVIWLQAMRDLYFPGQTFRIVPVLMGGLFETMQNGQLPADDHPITRFGRALRHSFDMHAGGSAVCIASIDGCHVGPRFDHEFPGLPPVQQAVQKWERSLWRNCRSDRLLEFIHQLSTIQNAFYFDGAGVLHCLLRNFKLKAAGLAGNLWYEPRDQSFVTFTSGYFQELIQPDSVK